MSAAPSHGEFEFAVVGDGRGTTRRVTASTLDHVNLQRALESRRPGVPGVRLRRVDPELPPTLVLPGTGDAVVTSDARSARPWRRFGSVPTSSTPRWVAENAAEFMANRLGRSSVVFRGVVSVRGGQ